MPYLLAALPIFPRGTSDARGALKKERYSMVKIKMTGGPQRRALILVDDYSSVPRRCHP